MAMVAAGGRRHVDVAGQAGYGRGRRTPAPHRYGPPPALGQSIACSITTARLNRCGPPLVTSLGTGNDVEMDHVAAT